MLFRWNTVSSILIGKEERRRQLQTSFIILCIKTLQKTILFGFPEMAHCEDCSVNWKLITFCYCLKCQSFPCRNTRRSRVMVQMNLCFVTLLASFDLWRSNYLQFNSYHYITYRWSLQHIEHCVRVALWTVQ